MNIQEFEKYEFNSSGATKGVSRWYITYSDIITLLLGFFAIIISVSEVNPAKVEQVTNSASENFGTTGLEKKAMVISIEEIVRRVNQIIKEEKLEKQVEVSVTNRGVIVSLKDAMFFQSGSAEVLSKAYPVLSKLSDQIGVIPYNIAVEGHTDNVPTKKTSRYPSNWELSSARASNIVRFLISEGVEPSKLRAVGYADTVSKVENDSDTNRAINRRIEIVFLTS